MKIREQFRFRRWKEHMSTYLTRKVVLPPGTLICCFFYNLILRNSCRNPLPSLCGFGEGISGEIRTRIPKIICKASYRNLLRNFQLSSWEKYRDTDKFLKEFLTKFVEKHLQKSLEEFLKQINTICCWNHWKISCKSLWRNLCTTFWRKSCRNSCMKFRWTPPRRGFRWNSGRVPWNEFQNEFLKKKTPLKQF